MTREEAIDVLKHNYPSACFEDLCKAVDIAIKVLSTQSESERKKGKWIKYTGMGKVQWMCSECSAEEKNPKVANYCYNCGADMRGEEDE